MKLYVYEHCPFCVRARMIFGLRKVQCEVIYLPNDDEATPKALIGRKMLPILELDDGEVLSESLDIVGRIDLLTGKSALAQPVVDGVGAWIDTHSATIYKLAIPRWAYTDFPEFRDLSARQYFIDKKQRVFGSFSLLVNESDVLVDRANQALEELKALLERATASETTWSPTDVLLYPVLRSLSIVKGIVWPAEVLAWCEHMSEACDVPLHTDIAL